MFHIYRSLLVSIKVHGAKNIYALSFTFRKEVYFPIYHAFLEGTTLYLTILGVWQMAKHRGQTQSIFTERFGIIALGLYSFKGLIKY